VCQYCGEAITGNYNKIRSHRKICKNAHLQDLPSSVSVWISLSSFSLFLF